MAFKTVAAVLQGRPDTDRVLDFLAPFAMAHGSHVVGIHAEQLPMAYASPMGFADVTFLDVLSDASARHAAEMKQRFQSRMDAEGISAEWLGFESFSGDSASSALANARAADLVVAQQVDPDAASDDIANVETLLFESGRPVLLVPYAGALATTIANVMIAWNGSREASRAAFDALPFLKQARKVELLLIDEKPDAGNGWSDGAEIASALARHGVRVEIRTETVGGVPISAVIQNRVAETAADLLVMGAYSHSRLREWLVGGPTRTVLDAMPSLTLMSR